MKLFKTGKIVKKNIKSFIRTAVQAAESRGAEQEHKKVIERLK